MLLVEATIETAVIICIICGISSIVGFLVDKKVQKKVRMDG
ncbi:hypothetical protein [Metabacillus litoralis]|nr:hypothetical protein [Metabacillus litoralis]